ncbi:MAG: ferrous iron transporter B [Planctomycetia bacterium]|nr:ferrous iron transporter B [Planctomycetia bacterium]
MTEPGGRERPLIVALVGNPNTGKSTLFTALAGIPTRIGNYPGVTVEEKVGRFSHHGRDVDLVDLPGTYSLRAQSPDEQVAVDVLCGRMRGVPKPDCAIVVVDASNLARNLFLTSQVLDLGLPTVVALTLGDLAAERGITVDADSLARRLGCPVIPVVVPQGVGVSTLRDSVVGAAAALPPPPPALAAHLADADAERPPAARDAIARYAWIDGIAADVIRRSDRTGRSRSEAIDAILTHRVWGTLVFAMVMLALFTSIFRLASPAMDLISAGMDGVAAQVEASLPEGPLRSLLVDGVLAGVGGVVVFVPQIALLFLFIAILEGCGYLSRAAFLMDRLLVGAGLSGKSFIPLLSSFACAIPGIMAARTIENRRDRLLTILVAPLMSCSARLPVYLLLCGAFVPDAAVVFPWLRLPAVVLVAMYALGVIVAAAVAFGLSRTVFRGPPQPFVMELPGWRWPQAAVVLERVREAAWSFLKNAGTLILAMSIVLWALGTYPRPVLPAGGEFTEAEARGEALRQSFLGRAGRAIEPLVKPLGWDWRLGCAALASFPAREVVLGTLGVIYNLGDVDPGDEEGGTMLVRRLKAATWDGTERKVFSLPVALSIMVFFALCAQCASTLAVIGRETGSWVWPVVTFAYMTSLAWLGAFAIYQLGTALGW